MPKENIHSIKEDHIRVELYWYGDPAEGTGHVHLTTVNMDLETSGDDPVPEHYKGFTVDLDEAGITRLIKALHKAKRQAFPPNGVPHADGEICEHNPDGGNHPVWSA
jgi:hypothetical protein